MIFAIQHKRKRIKKCTIIHLKLQPDGLTSVSFAYAVYEAIQRRFSEEKADKKKLKHKARFHRPIPRPAGIKAGFLGTSSNGTADSKQGAMK